MSEPSTPTVNPDTETAERPVPPQRGCTRCDGQQHLVASGAGMGKYRCDTCQLIVGFDLDQDAPEFLLDRGMPSRYTKDVFGDRLTPPERRMAPATPEPAQG